MKAEDKAKELVERFDKLDTPHHRDTWYKHDAIQCALICVEEIIKTEPKYASYPSVGMLIWESHINYWQDVKTEIQKL